MERTDYLVLLILAGCIYSLAGLVMLWRALKAHRWAWIGHVVPLFYVSGTYFYLDYLLVNQISAGQAVEYFVWGQLLMGLWILLVLVQHQQRYRKLMEIAPEILELLDDSY